MTDAGDILIQLSELEGKPSDPPQRLTKRGTLDMRGRGRHVSPPKTHPWRRMPVGNTTANFKHL